MKALFFVVIFLLVMPISFASLEITSNFKEKYNLGDIIESSVRITAEKYTEGLIKATLKCTDKEVLYYAAPISMEQGETKTVEIPSVKAFSDGACNVRIDIENLDGESLDGITSENFNVIDKIELEFSLDKSDALPGDTIKVSGNANKENSKLDGSLIIKFDENEDKSDFKGGDFSHNIKLDKTIKSGEHIVIVQVRDGYGNYNEQSSNIHVKAVPTKLEFEIAKQEFEPVDTPLIKVILLDQAGDDINENINVKLYEKKLLKDKIAWEGDVKANEEFKVELPTNTPPGDYVFVSDFNKLEAEKMVEILQYKKIEMRVEGQNVIVKNAGNVKYNGEATIILEKDGESFLINKKIKLDVGEEMKISLAKEVPSGNYKVNLPEDALQDNNSNKEVVIGGGKNGLGGITGAIIGGFGALVKRPKIASVIMLIVIILLVIYFNRKRIKKLLG